MESVQRVVLGTTPGNVPTPSDFQLISEDHHHELDDGQVRVRAHLFGLNAGLRTRLGTGLSTTLGPAIGIGDTPQSDAVGVIAESRHAGLAVGDTVVGLLPWSTAPIADGATLHRLDPAADPLRHLTILGHVGLTAYAGLVSVGRLQRGEVVWISAAAGGVGTCAVQIADRLGAKVIASASGRERIDFLRNVLGIAHVMERKLELMPQLQAMAPEGLDLYFDAVGGDHLSTALAAMKERGRVVLVGSVGGRSHEPVVQDSSLLIRKRISLTGLSVTDHAQARIELQDLVAVSDRGRAMVSVAHTHSGIANLAEAFCELLAGRFIGRGVVDVRTSLQRR